MLLVGIKRCIIPQIQHANLFPGQALTWNSRSPERGGERLGTRLPQITFIVCKPLRQPSRSKYNKFGIVLSNCKMFAINKYGLEFKQVVSLSRELLI